MSEREIRRAMGPEALDLIGQQGKAIAQVADGLSAHRALYLGDARTRNNLFAALIRRVTALETRVVALEDWRSRGLMDRVRWLLFGT